MIKDKLEIPFRLKDIENKQWAVFPENYNEVVPEFNMSFNSDFSIDTEHRIICIYPKITLSQDEKAFLIIETEFSFLIDLAGWKKMINKNKFIIPKGFKEHMLVIAIGTLRGIIFEKTNTKNSVIKSFVLPAIDVRNGTGDDIIFELTEEEY
jgi:hypothetical protein